MERLIYHVDVNSAYLSWEATEQLKNGAEIDIRDIPAIIGGDTARRKVHSGESLWNPDR